MCLSGAAQRIVPPRLMNCNGARWKTVASLYIGEMRRMFHWNMNRQNSVFGGNARYCQI